MSNRVKIEETKAIITVEETSSQQDPCIARIPVPDDESASYYSSRGYKVITIRLGAKKPSRFALYPMSSAEDARAIERAYGACDKREERHNKAIRKNECSLTGLMDAGYDPSLDTLDIALDIDRKSATADEGFNEQHFADHRMNPTRSRGGYISSEDSQNPETLSLQREREDAVHSALAELSPEQRNIVSIVMSGQSERAKAAELGIRQSTLHDRKMKALKELSEKLKNIQ